MNFLRWISFIPLAFSISGLAGGLAYWSVKLSYKACSLPLFEYYAARVNGAVTSYYLLIIGFKIAPFKNNYVKWTLISLCILLSILWAISSFILGVSESRVSPATGIMMILVGCAYIKTSPGELEMQGDIK